MLVSEYERIRLTSPAGVVAMACMQRCPDATREGPGGDRGMDQPETRERQAGPFGVTERSVVCAEQRIVREG